MTVLIDTSYFYYRFAHGINAMNPGQPINTGAGILYTKSAIKRIRKRFGQTSDIVFCIDSSGNWRKQVFKQYKAGRAKARNENQIFDFQSFFDSLAEWKNWLNESKDVMSVGVVGAEADDVIMVLSKHVEDCVIIAKDKDFQQLGREQYDMNFKLVTDPDWDMFKHILKGDVADGIPPADAPDNFFTDGRGDYVTKRMTKKHIAWLATLSREDLESLYPFYNRNETLISAAKIPSDIESKIITTYEFEVLALDTKQGFFEKLIKGKTQP